MNEYLGKNIRDLRKRKDLTQEQFAEQLGVSFQSVSRWENCVTYPDVEMIPAIARFFGVSTDYLFGVPEEEKKAKFKSMMKELIDLPESASERAIEIIRAVRLEYDVRSVADSRLFGDLCGALYYSPVKKSEEVTNELRKTADLFFEGNPAAYVKTCMMQRYACLEDEEYISSFLDKYSADESTVRDILLYERYLYRDDFDNLEKVRQRKVFKSVCELFDGTSWKDWRSENDVNFAFWKNELFLDFLHSFTNEKPTEEHPITCGKEPDIFVGQRINSGELRSCYLATLGRIDEAYVVLEDTVSLMEQFMALPNGAIIESRSPALPTLSFKIEDKASNRRVVYINNEDPHIMREELVVVSEIDYERLTSDPRWAWFNPIRDDERFNKLAERVKKLVTER